MVQTNEKWSNWYQRCINDPECNKRRRQRRQAQRERYKSMGICATCGTNIVSPGYATCAVCIRRIRSNISSRRQTDKEYVERQRMMTRMWGWMTKCKAVDILGGSCILCGQHDVRILEFDHINNDGKTHRKEIKGTTMPVWVVNNPEEASKKVQVLCANCHAYKRYERSMS